MVKAAPLASQHVYQEGKVCESWSATGCSVCRLISQLTAVMDQVSSSKAAASAAAVAASDTELAAVAAAASRLAIFFPQTHLLTLGQIPLSCIELEPASDSSIRASKQSCIARLGLDLAEALITTWTQKKDGLLQRGSYLDEEDWNERSVAAWSDIIKGLIRMALMRGAAASNSAETAADVLLLKALRKHHSSASHRYLSIFLFWKGGAVRGCRGLCSVV